MRNYISANEFSFNGIVMLVLATIFAGIVLGLLLGFVGQFFFLVGIFPALVGIAGGYVLAQAIKKFKMPNKAVAILMGILMGVMIYGSYTYFDYLQFQNQLYDAMVTFGDPTLYIFKDMDKATLTNFLLQETTGSTGLIGYWKSTVNAGISIISMGGMGSNFPFNPLWSTLYLISEFLLIAGFAIQGAWEQVNRSFCSRCREWYDKGKELALFEMEDENKVINAIEHDRYDELKEIMPIEVSKLPCLILKAHSCLKCHNETPLLELSRLTVGDKGERRYKRRFRGLITSSQLNELEDKLESESNREPA